MRWLETKLRKKEEIERGRYRGVLRKKGGGQWGISPLRSVESMVSREFSGPNGC